MFETLLRSKKYINENLLLREQSIVLYKNTNAINRNIWLQKTLANTNKGDRILDAGAGELRNKPFCNHLDYVSQDFCQYEGTGNKQGLQTGKWDTSQIDLICDIIAIPEADRSFDIILCSEVLEHIPDPTKALDEFNRLLKHGGNLIITAPFASLVHFAPYHYCSGFSRYWYEYHLTQRGFDIIELSSNGDWFSYCQQEFMRLGPMARQRGDYLWPFAYVMGILGAVYFKFRGGEKADDLACFGWQCVAVKRSA